MGFESPQLKSGIASPGAIPAEAAFPGLNSESLGQTVRDYNAEHAKFAESINSFVSADERTRLKTLQLGHNLQKPQADAKALEIVGKPLPAHVALCQILDQVITEAVRADRKILRGVFRSFMANLNQTAAPNLPSKVGNAAEELLMRMNFSLRGQAGLIATLTSRAEHFSIQQRAALSALIVERMQQKNDSGHDA